jgi:hypothetical protein
VPVTDQRGRDVTHGTRIEAIHGDDKETQHKQQVMEAGKTLAVDERLNVNSLFGFGKSSHCASPFTPATRSAQQVSTGRETPMVVFFNVCLR